MPLTIRCVGDDPPTCALVREVVGTAMPTATVWLEGPEMLVIDAAAAGECVVLAGVVAGEAPLDAARRLRSAGLAATLVGIVAREALARELPEMVAEAAAVADTVSPALLELRRMQQLVAAGEMTSRLQHALNNPLTALMAEAQLLEMEPLGDEQRQAVSRMVELCRRLVGIVRQLDAVGGAQAPSAPESPADVGTRDAAAPESRTRGVSRTEESAS